MNYPNIVYIHSHDSGRYIQPYGAPMRSPRLQSFAEDAVVFRQAFAASPACSPSRASLLTGQWSHSAGMLGLANRGFTLPGYDKHLITFLHSHGYRSALAGLQHISPDTAAIGYTEILERRDWSHDQQHGSDLIAASAVEYLERSASEPFFLDVGFFDTHRPYGVPEDDIDPRWMAPPAPLPDVPATREDAAGYQSSLRRFDTAVGRVLDAVQTQGLADNTIVIITTDHGLASPGMKVTLRDSGIGVMLLVRGPGNWRGGKVLDSLVTQIDLFPTLCELIGVQPPEHLQGTSLVPLVDSQVAQVHEEIFAEVNYHVGYEPQRCVRTLRWKYIRRYLDRDSEAFAHVDRSPSRDFVRAQGWFGRPYVKEMLFDTVLDPLEQHNLVDSSEHDALLGEMRRRLQLWQEQTEDPLLEGPVALPPGAHVDDIETWSSR
ncbi:sulfatase [Microbacterium marmarense]|uniref:Sulfatase n=1 Tax=Microbacterium marmarense TaxID=3122051 RepID=A0ABU8LSZ3_9MICO